LWYVANWSNRVTLSQRIPAWNNCRNTDSECFWADPCASYTDGRGETYCREKKKECLTRKAFMDANCRLTCCRASKSTPISMTSGLRAIRRMRNEVFSFRWTHLKATICALPKMFPGFKPTGLTGKTFIKLFRAPSDIFMQPCYLKIFLLKTLITDFLKIHCVARCCDSWHLRKGILWDFWHCIDSTIEDWNACNLYKLHIQQKKPKKYIFLKTS